MVLHEKRTTHVIFNYEGSKYSVKNGFLYQIDNGFHYTPVTKGSDLERIAIEHGWKSNIIDNVNKFHTYSVRKNYKKGEKND